MTPREALYTNRHFWSLKAVNTSCQSFWVVFETLQDIKTAKYLDIKEIWRLTLVLRRRRLDGEKHDVLTDEWFTVMKSVKKK